MKFKLILLSSILCFASINAEAGWWADKINFLKEDILDMYCRHNYDLYVPFYAWHNRLTYDQ